MKIQEVVDEPADSETLYLKYKLIHDHNLIEIIAIGVLEEDAKKENGTISLQLIHFPEDGICKVLQACLLENEIDLVIKGLKEAKKRLLEFKSIV